MRSLYGRAAATLRRFARGLGQAQGVVGVGCVALGAFLQFGLGWALLLVGGFFLVGAWGSR